MSEQENMNPVKEIPYGISDFELIRKENYYYVDKTQYLKTIKKTGRYLFFIRPRRFGKSLFLSMMETYYDVFYNERFEELFEGTAIYEDPTEDRNAYLMLKFNFSIVNPAMAKVEASFLEHVQGTALSFIKKYSDYLAVDRDYFIERIKKGNSASDILSILVRLCKDSHQKLYVIIDEYDNFANTILSTTGKDAYETLTHGAGSFRAFFNVLKGGTDGTGAPFSRLFLSGVSPITLDDVTSGYNIGENVSLDTAFNSMPGFTGAEVKQMLDYYKAAGRIKHETGYLAEIIKEWYGNYLFSEYPTGQERLYNPDMVLYFLREYFKAQTIPRNLIDRNVKIDYGKLRYLIIVDRGNKKTANGNFSRLKEIIEKGETSAALEKGFPLEKVTAEDNFISLLFYFGLLTIKEVELDQFVLTIPNETIRRLFYDYIKEGYEETDVFALDLSTYSRLMKGMAMKGAWEPLLDYITGRMRESISLRDLITGEKSIQAFLNVYLGLSNLYIIYPEKELNKGYADIVMEPFLARYEGIKYSYILEIKYLKAGIKPGDEKIQQLKAEAEEQLDSYSIDEKFRKNIEKTSLIKLALIFSGHECIYTGTG
ncbi:MAG: AAA family ATPase [bacterium]|nr:AAA family ATPase [bacterium]